MKYTKIIFIISFIFTLYSCKTGMYVTNTVSQINTNSGVIYALPKTKLNIQIEITETHKQKGPFSKYTYLYFSTKNAITKNETKYRISDVSISTSPILDSANIYCVTNNDNEIASLLSLTNNGFIAGINLSDYQSEKLETEQKKISSSNINNKFLDYANFSLKSIREIQYDTTYKEVMQDSILVKIPIIKKKEVFKSLKKQAKETADILFLLRDDKNALLKGENDGNNFPDGDALKLMLNELNKLEQQYMSLFTGQEIKIKKQYNFEIIPKEISNDSLFFLFNFSQKNGYSSIKNNSEKNIYLKLYENLSLGSTLEYTHSSITTIKHKAKSYPGIIYRIPKNVNAEIIMNNSIIYKKNIKISQAGLLNIIPSNVLKNDIKVEFFPQYGSLKRISKIKSE